MQELGRGMKVFDHPPVRGAWRTFRTSADLAGVEGPVVAVVRDPGAVWLASLGESLVAVVCTTGTPRSHVGIMAANLGVPCVVAAAMAEVPEDGRQVEVDCSGDDGLVRG
ncbi:MAG TPA: PEP-utilizing enzyme [Acidimicrobiales bacterium]|nr:PEP-utilizing enzyme [Acidimicrobiales bacterium]